MILDTDIGTDVDDAVALALLLASPEVDLDAVTTVSGDVGLRARIAKKLLMLAGRADVPVFAGCAEPRGEGRQFLWLGHEGDAIVGEDDQLTFDGAHAVDELVGSAKDIVAIGPLTNIAAAVERAPDRARQLTLMGGVIGFSDDSTTPEVEYNLGSDAESSVAALGAGIQTTIVPLDVTWQTRLRRRELEALRRSRSPLVHVLCDAMEIWWDIHRKLFTDKRTYGDDVVCLLHDPLALSLSIDPSFVTTTPMRLMPEIVDGCFRLRPHKTGHEFRVATKVDAPAFVEFVVARLMRLR